jgi:hypothetical protein
VILYNAFYGNYTNSHINYHYSKPAATGNVPDKIYLLKKYKAKAVVTTVSIVPSKKRHGARLSAYYFTGINCTVLQSGLLYSGKIIS